MGRGGWFEENGRRAWPFQFPVSRVLPDNTTVLPNGLLVDFGCLIGPRANDGSGHQFDPTTHTVSLTSIVRGTVSSITSIHFVFAMSLGGPTLTFSLPLPQPENVTVQVTSGDSTDSGCLEEPTWSGFLAVGNLPLIDSILPSDGTLTLTAAAFLVEPETINVIPSAFVRSITIANEGRTHATAPSGCSAITWPSVPDGITVGEISGDDENGNPIYVVETCIAGDIRIQPGYNADVRKDPAGNAISIRAAVGQGAGPPCGEVLVYPGETPPTGSAYPEGGPGCNDVIRSVNGVGGTTFDIVGGQGVSVTSDPETNSITINVNMRGLSVCYTPP